MGGFFRKVAGAFVELEDGGSGGAKGGGGESASLDEITNDTSALLAQLEGMGGGAPSPAPASSAAAMAQGAPPPPVPGAAVEVGGSALTMNADTVFQQAGLVDGPNSAEKILKLVGGLAMFPPEQQVVMIRAMDTADEGWSEPEVLEDARNRQSVLRRHLGAIEQERDSRMKRLEEEIAAVQAESASIIEEIDRKIADLQQKRQGALVDSTQAVSDLQTRQAELDAEAKNARNGITHVINALSQLITFFTGGKQGAG